MAVEIERRFVVIGDAWRGLAPACNTARVIYRWKRSAPCACAWSATKPG